MHYMFSFPTCRHLFHVWVTSCSWSCQGFQCV